MIGEVEKLYYIISFVFADLLELCDPVKGREILAEESEQSESDIEEIDEEHLEAEEIDLNEDTSNSDADVSVKQKVRRVSFADTPQVCPQVTFISVVFYCIRYPSLAMRHIALWCKRVIKKSQWLFYININ